MSDKLRNTIILYEELAVASRECGCSIVELIESAHRSWLLSFSIILNNKKYMDSFQKKVDSKIDLLSK